jgi:hypothetical protein
MDPSVLAVAMTVVNLASRLYIKSFRNVVILAAAIAVFTISGTGMIVGSAFVTAWPQSFLLGLGISLLMVGTVELGLLGALRHVLEAKPMARLSLTSQDDLPGIAAALDGLSERLRVLIESNDGTARGSAPS